MANSIGNADYTTIQGENRSNPTAGGNLLQTLMGTGGTTLAQGDLQLGAIGQQIGAVNAQLPETIAYNNAMAGYQKGGLDIAGQQIGVSQLGNQQQQAQAATQQGFEQQQYAIQQGQFPQQQAEAALAYQNSLRNTQGSQAIGGTQNTVGGKADVSTLGQQYQFQLQDINRAQQLSQLGQKSELSQYGFNQEQLQNASKNLSLSAAANGLSQNQMADALKYGNQQSAESAQQNILQLYGQYGQAELGQINNVGSILSQAGFRGGVNALAGLG